ncbi:hypothetical protein VMCG_04637 [Cytospora schulzeri]|uniref:Uncharacterized protein n=1 Tax=Cytospora schulzeri TaxID=448051 RepID=A0A423WRW1_9PEZI|nr:hypothetical protein VMCG_04637 [Valsa malicola]
MTSIYGGTLASSADVGGDGGATIYHLAMTSSNATAEATQSMTNALKFATSKSIRTSTIILASFNALAALATALGIIYSCYTHNKRAQRILSNSSVMQYEMKPFSIPTPDRPSGLFFIHTVEVFPLVLSLGIATQSVIFAAAQSIGLQALLSRGCTAAAVFMLPALFIAPYIQLVFGVETAVRGVRSQFSARRKWTVALCLGFVATFLLVSLFVAVGNKAPDYCFASLFWIIEHFAVGGFVLFLLISIALVIAISIILVKLCRSHMVEPVERLAASRMVYYLALGLISNAFIVPYFFSLTFLDQKTYIFETLNLSMIASVVSNVNGLMVACLHMFLRSHNTAIGYNCDDYDRDNYKHEPRDSGDEDRGSIHTMQPVTEENDRNRAASDSIEMLHHTAEAEETTMGRASTRSIPLGLHIRPTITVPDAPTFPEPTQPPPTTSPSRLRRQSYSLFPNSPSAATLPATAYSSVATKPARDSIRPPPIVKPWLGRGHRRESSIESSATVQIGLRISNVDDIRPSKASMDSQRPETVMRPSPLARTENMLTSYNVAPENIAISDARMKTLPPVPTTCVEEDETEAATAGGNGQTQTNREKRDQSQPITLNPSVYTPEDRLVRRTASNKSVNRSARVPNLAGARLSMMANRGNGDGVIKHAPPRPDGPMITTQVPKTKADWI